jgi:asparagine synthase (glutamine-hydrolysing)
MSTVHACWLHKVDTVDQTLTGMLSASDYWQPDNRSRWASKQSEVGLAKAQLYNATNSQKDTVYHAVELGLTITSNARIDNRSELLSALGLDAADKCIDTDSRLILHCYAKWGKSLPSRLRGDFVFIIWDENQQKFFCARDHFGVKTLFYCQNSQGIMLSNEHNAFFNSRWCAKNKVDEKWIVEQIWALGPKEFDSPHPEIKVLPPAHTLEIDHQGAKLSQYWRLAPKTDWQHLSDEALIGELKVRFQKAVIVRLDSDYPIAAELSEGLDSNGIAGVAARHISPNSVYTFSYQCRALNNENSHIWADTYRDIEAMLAMHKNLKPIWTTRGSDEPGYSMDEERLNTYSGFGGVLSHSYSHREMDLAGSSRVLLSGWGGDHCVSSPGDEYAKELLSKGRIFSLYRLLKGQKRRGRGSNPLRSLLVMTIKRLLPTPLLFYLAKRGKGLLSTITYRSKVHFLHPKWVSRFRLDSRLTNFLKDYYRPTVRQHEIRELFEIGLTNRLTHSELTARGKRYEYRFPMIDVDLVEFAHSLPGRLKIHQGIERYPFRRVLEGFTTPRIQWRIKSDVAHPNIDRLHMGDALKNQLAEELTQSSLMRQYGSENWTKEFIDEGDPIILRAACLMLDIEKYYGITLPDEAKSATY